MGQFSVSDNRLASEAGSNAGKYNYATYLFQNSSDQETQSEALKLITDAADEGYTRAQNRLGLMYVQGAGVEINHDLAFHYFNASAEANDPEGITSLGINYCNGYGCEKDEIKACELFLLAANSGFAQAQFNLAWNYHHGIGVNQDLDLAFKYYLQASEQNHAGGMRGVGQLRSPELVDQLLELGKARNSTDHLGDQDMASIKAATKCVVSDGQPGLLLSALGAL